MEQVVKSPAAVQTTAVGAKQNVFPFEEVFPRPLAELIHALHRDLGFPVDFSATAILTAFAAAIGSTIQLKMKNLFTAIASLNCVLVGNPGTCKSHPIQRAFAPFELIRARRFAAYKKEMAEYRRRKAEGNPGPKPVLRTPILNELTLEALYRSMEANPRGVAIVADEMNGFLENMNRYNTGSDAEAFNTIWSGLPQSINRASVDSRYIHRVAVSIIGTMQTAIMHKFFTRDKAGSGCSSRFLFTAPENLTMPHWSASEIDPALTEQYEKAILRLLDREMEKDADGIPQPTEIGVTPEALQRMLSWHNDEYRPRTQEEMGDTYADACCKLDTYALRFALILEVMRAALEEREPVAVGMDSVEGAIRLVEYFRQEAIKIHKLVYGKDIRISMTEQQRKAYDALPPSFRITAAYELLEKKIGFSKDQVKKFLGKQRYFTRIVKGEYRKNYVEISE